MPNKKNLKWYVAVLLFVAAAAFLLNVSYKAYIDTGARSSKYRISMIMKSTDSEFFKSVFSGGNAAATEYNVELDTMGPEDEEDYETQNEMIREAVDGGSDGIVFSAVDFNANGEAVDYAASKGVPVVIIDSDVNSDKVSRRISTDNYEAGRMAARAVIEASEGFDEFHIGIVNFDRNTENGRQREQGFREAISTDERVESIESTYVLSTVDDACRGTKELLATSPETNVIVTFNEWTSLGVGRAIYDLGNKDSVSVIAFDSNEVCVNFLETGEVDALIVQNPYAMGYLGVESAYRLAEGEELSEDTVYTETTIVTRENMFEPEYQRILFKYE